MVKGLDILNRDDGGKDFSDPIAYLSLEGSKKFEEKKSKILFDNLNPLWNEKFEFPFQNIEKKAIDLLMIKLEDYDKWGRNDELGSLEIYLDDLWENKNKWAIGNLFQV